MRPSCGRATVGTAIAPGTAWKHPYADADALQPYACAAGIPPELETTAVAVVRRGSAAVVRHVMIGGQWALRDGRAPRVAARALDRAYAELGQATVTATARSRLYGPSP